MYEYLIGTITYITPYYLVLEVNGIGYQIALGNPYRYSSKLNKEEKIYVHQVVREDAHALFGFGSLAEKQLFLRLISVSGIGPKSGLAIMADDDHQGLIQAIENGDVTYLVRFPGIGKKTAQQLILDLKGKLGELADGPIQKQTDLLTADEGELGEAMAALGALGYSDKEIKRVKKVLGQENLPSTDAYLRAALKLMK